MTEPTSASSATEPDEALGERARHLAGDARKELLDRANESGAKGLSSMGKKLDDAADYVRARGPEAAKRLHVDEAHADRFAEGIHGAADYMQSRDPRSMINDLDQAIQKHPYRALIVGAAIGYAIGRFFRRD